MAKKNVVQETSNFNLQVLNTEQFSEHVRCSIDIGSNVAVFGRRGGGKTAISEFQINKSGLNEVYINLSVFERPDLAGYPNVLNSERKDYVSFMLPDFYRNLIEGDRDSVILFDEVDKADPSLWAPLLEITLQRSINGKKLPRLRSVIMTGNLIAEGGNRPSLPLLDRTEKYLLEPNAKMWLEWGSTNNLHSSISAFISDKPQCLCGDLNPDDRYADKSPRSWTMASNILHNGEKRGWDIHLLNEKVAGCVGQEAALQFQSYYNYYKSVMPLVSKVFKGENIDSAFRDLTPSEKVVCTMVTFSRLSSLLDDSVKKVKEIKETKEINLTDALDNLPKFLDVIDREILLIGVRSQLGAERIGKFGLLKRQDWLSTFKKIKMAA